MDLGDALIYLGVLVFGYLLGALKPFLGEVLANWWRRRQARKRRDEQFREMREKMPALLEEMQKDLDEHPYIREFIVLNKRAIQFQHEKPRFEYYRDEHDSLYGKLSILENHGLIEPVPHPNTSMYRLSEEFVDRVKNV